MSALDRKKGRLSPLQSHLAGIVDQLSSGYRNRTTGTGATGRWRASISTSTSLQEDRVLSVHAGWAGSLHRTRWRPVPAASRRHYSPEPWQHISHCSSWCMRLQQQKGLWSCIQAKPDLWAGNWHRQQTPAARVMPAALHMLPTAHPPAGSPISVSADQHESISAAVPQWATRHAGISHGPLSPTGLPAAAQHTASQTKGELVLRHDSADGQ